MFIHPSKTSKVFAAKSIVVVPSLFATMAWAIIKAGGPNFDKLVVTTVGGAQLGWGFMRALNSTVSNGKPLVVMHKLQFGADGSVIPPLVNVADLARYANNPRQTWTIVSTGPLSR
jgi:NCS1 family nucleobase:cation symporter-1